MQPTPAESLALRSLLQSLCGVTLADDKTYLLTTRLAAPLQARGITSFADYLQQLRQPGNQSLRDELVDSLTTSETSFFRDPAVYRIFRERILPWLVDVLHHRALGSKIPPVVRIWSAGCSTGQEPCSLAIAICEFLAGLATPHPRQFSLVATDFSRRVLAVAQRGVYTTRELERGLTLGQRQRHFRPAGEDWELLPEVRRLIDYRHASLLDSSSPAGPFDVIFCRNVLIYFDSPTRARVCERLFRALNPGGVLVLGSAESLFGVTDLFVPVDAGGLSLYLRPDPGKTVPAW
ncbi:MAG: CheR family methyltransferase [Planctomycetaceae bacterium]